ncbi:MAG TPA: cytochrome d ubiquinol oxidase subunit II [Chloroflexota bacterium]
MHLYDLPLLFVLVGLALYTVLGGADFGAGIWQLTAGGGASAKRIRDHAHDAMAPVWEANHVWLIVVLTVTWTAYPAAFASIASTLCVPLFIAAVGIILRGATYALRSGASSPREMRLIDTGFAISSVLTPFALGTVVGAIASGRVPVGNAAGNLITSWTGSVSITIGVLAVATAAYLAAVYLAADAARLGDSWLENQFRARALIIGVVAGAAAIAGLVVLRANVHPLYHRLVNGDGAPALVVSILAGVTTLALVWWRRYELARYSAALAVVAIIAGWALAQQPRLLPGLTVAQAAAPRDTLVLVVVAVLAGGVILFPSLGLLFRLLLHGQFDPNAAARPGTLSSRRRVARPRSGLLTRTAVACLVTGFGLLVVADAAWAHAIGVTCLLVFIALAFSAIGPDEIASIDPGDTEVAAHGGDVPLRASGRGRYRASTRR